MIHEVVRLGHLGDGMTEDGLRIPRSLPGEAVDGTVAGDKIANPKILKSSEHRVSAPCKHFKSCGGCALQHASDGFVAAWKAEVVENALNAQGIDVQVRAVHTSPPRTRRRATLSARRLKNGAVVGFHQKASDALVQVSDCAVLSPEIAAIIEPLRTLTARIGTRRQEIKYAVTTTAPGLDIAVETEIDLDRSAREALAGWAGEHGIARLTVSGEDHFRRAAPQIDFDGIAVEPPPGAFLQATLEGETALRRAVTEAIGDAGAVADLFSGCGTFALPMARRARVDAFEGDDAMARSLERAYRNAQGLKPLRALTRDLFRRPLLAKELDAYDAIVIDPARAGARAQFREIAESNVPRVAAISCNPVTFARDARLLIEGGYTLNWIEVIDQFRWSPHIELASFFARDHILSDKSAGER